MKKILIILTIILSSLFCMIKVDASSFNVNITGSNTFESEVTLYVQVNNLQGFDGSCNGLCGLVGNLSYDSNKIELIDISALQNFDLTQGKKIVLFKATGVSGGTNVLLMKFKNKALVNDESTTITLSNISASDGDKDIVTSNASKTIKFIKKEVTTTTTTKKQDVTTTKKQTTTSKSSSIDKITTKTTSKTTTTKKEETKKSSNNNLKSIKLSAGNINFSKDVLTYDVLVDENTDKITIETSCEDKKASVDGTGTYSLKSGINSFKLTVKAEDGSTKTYTINITKDEEQTEDTFIEDDTNEELKEDIIDVTKKEEKETEKNNNSKLILFGILVLLIGVVTAIIIKNKLKKD